MARQRELRIVVATDGSPSGRAAVATAALVPWAGRQRVEAMVATVLDARAGARDEVRKAVQAATRRIATAAQHRLAARWPDAGSAVVTGTPVAATIVRHARRVRASVIVMGWRGHGTLRQLLAGSVSRGVVRMARGPVLVVRRAPSRVQRLVIGIDGSRNAHRAAQFVADRVRAPRGGEITLVRAVEPTQVRSAALLPGGTRNVILREAAALDQGRRAAAKVELDRLGRALQRKGWRVRARVASGTPLSELLAAVAAARANLLVVGARGTGGLKRLLLGSVAEGAFNHSPVPVLIVR